MHLCCGVRNRKLDCIYVSPTETDRFNVRLTQCLDVSSDLKFLFKGEHKSSTEVFPRRTTLFRSTPHWLWCEFCLVKSIPLDVLPPLSKCFLRASYQINMLHKSMGCRKRSICRARLATAQVNPNSAWQAPATRLQNKTKETTWRVPVLARNWTCSIRSSSIQP